MTDGLRWLPTNGWPKGWWRVPRDRRYTCCHPHAGMKGRACVIAAGQPVYLNGISGAMFCQKHARSEGAPPLALGASDGR